jgi:hypothetical protein
MTTNQSIGFHQADGNGERALQRRTTAITELFLTLALAVSTAIAVTAISVEMAHATTLEQIAPQTTPTMAWVMLLGGIFVAMGGLTAIVTRDGERRARGR